MKSVQMCRQCADSSFRKVMPLSDAFSAAHRSRAGENLQLINIWGSDVQQGRFAPDHVLLPADTVHRSIKKWRVKRRLPGMCFRRTCTVCALICGFPLHVRPAKGFCREKGLSCLRCTCLLNAFCGTKKSTCGSKCFCVAPPKKISQVLPFVYQFY